ncbi:MAG TPA: ArsB/NhaD family transporter [Spirochaetota bacterium]|nr:ArsB/NhaD family transporter [Spirochaetota bacterium]
MDFLQIIGLIVFVAVYICLSTDIINKTIISLLGGALFVLMGVLDQEKAFHIIDWNVIFLLMSMMVIVGIIKKTGLSQFVAIKAAKFVNGDPIKILILFVIITALFSALLGTVTTTLLIVPVSILIAVELGISPIPYIICEAMAANIGGCATLVGDATTIMIGSASKIDFLKYMMLVDPILLVILIVLSFIIVIIFKKQLKVSNERKARIMDFDESKSIENFPLLIKSLVIITLIVIGFLTHNLTHFEPSTIALFGATTLMILAGGKEVDHYFSDVEWGTLFFFVGLFTLVGGIVELGLIKKLGNLLITLTGGDLKVTSIVIIWASGIISALVDNVPYVATMIPLIKDLGSVFGDKAMTPLWLSLLLGADLGGNGTLVGATANVVAAGLANKNGYKISFMDFTKYGAVITVINLFIVTIMLFIFHLK